MKVTIDLTGSERFSEGEEGSTMSLQTFRRLVPGIVFDLLPKVDEVVMDGFGPRDGEYRVGRPPERVKE